MHVVLDGLHQRAGGLGQVDGVLLVRSSEREPTVETGAVGLLSGQEAFVTGEPNVDALAELSRIDDDPPWAKLWFEVPEDLARQIASKGSVTLDGVSLTVVDVQGTRFSVALIPHTLAVTTLGSRRPGDRVNLETDILAKYIDRQLELRGQ